MAEVIDVQTLNNKIQENLIFDDQDDEKSKALRANQLRSLIESHKLCCSLVERLINNQDLEIIKYFEERKENKFINVHDCTFYATVNAYLALCNLFPEEIAKTVEIVKECVEYCNQRRKKWSLTSAVVHVLRMKPNYDSYTEEETQAEICYAGLMMIRGVLNFVRDNNFFTLISGSLWLKMAHQSFRLCNQLRKHRKFQNQELADTFIQSTIFGNGVYNVILSMIPKRILRILEMIGFTGDREKGLHMLAKGMKITQNLSTIGGLMCFSFITMDCLFLRYLLGNGSTEEEIKFIEPLLKLYSDRYPESAAVLYVQGRLQNVRGNCGKAMDLLQKSAEVDRKRLTVQLFSLWELSTCHLMEGDHRKAAQVIQRMRLETNLSKTIFAYVEGVFLLAANDLGEDDRKYAIELIQMAPELMAEYCGRKIPFEKWCTRKSRQFFAQDNFLLLPEYEVLYVFNSFFLLKNAPNVLHSIIKKVDQFLLDVNSRKDWNFYADNYCLAVFLKGLSLKYLGRSNEAYECFAEVLKRVGEVISEVNLVMYTHFEAGVLDWESGKLEEALNHFKLAKKRRLFWLEFRVHQAREEVEKLLKAEKKA